MKRGSSSTVYRLAVPCLLTLLPLLVWAHGDHDAAPWKFLLQFSAPFDSSWELWMYSFVSTALISAAPFFILFCIPLQNAKDHSSLLKVLLSFASGGLLGDAFLHLIPHSISPHDHSHGGGDHEDHAHSHDHHDDEHHHHGHDHMQDMIVGLWVLAGIVTFLAVEKFVRLAKGGHSHGHSHGHFHSDTPPPQEVEPAKEEDGVQDGGTVRKRKASGRTARVSPPPASRPSTSSPASPPHKPSSSTPPPAPPTIKVSAYLNLAADFAHNFTDGLAIGASYLAGRGVGLVTTLTILIHEVPHEIGDFAILVQSGFSKRRAMFMQLGTAVGAMAGTACGLFLEGGGASAIVWVLPFTAGGFIYIATVAVIPELLENTKFFQSLAELVAMGVGIALMVLITFVE